MWQGHFVDILLSKECPGTFKQSLKSPTTFHAKEFEIAVDLHVDDSHVTGPAENMTKVFAYLETKKPFEIPTHHLGRKLVRACWCSEVIDRRRRHAGERTGQVRIVRAVDEEGEGLPSIDESKFEKQTEPGDDDPCEQPEVSRLAVCTVLYITKRRSDLHATARCLCKRLRDPKPEVIATVGQNGPIHQRNERLGDFHAEVWQGRHHRGYLDVDCACDDTDRKSASGGCRLHSHSTTTEQHALSIGESEIMSMSELLKDATLTKYNS